MVKRKDDFFIRPVTLIALLSGTTVLLNGIDRNFKASSDPPNEGRQVLIGSLEIFAGLVTISISIFEAVINRR